MEVNRCHLGGVPAVYSGPIQKDFGLTMSLNGQHNGHWSVFQLFGEVFCYHYIVEGDENNRKGR